MPRTFEQRKYHADKEREYRRLRNEAKERQAQTFKEAAAELMARHGVTLGQLVDWINTDVRL